MFLSSRSFDSFLSPHLVIPMYLLPHFSKITENGCRAFTYFSPQQNVITISPTKGFMQKYPALGWLKNGNKNFPICCGNRGSNPIFFETTVYSADFGVGCNLHSITVAVLCQLCSGLWWLFKSVPRVALDGEKV